MELPLLPPSVPITYTEHNVLLTVTAKQQTAICVPLLCLADFTGYVLL